MLGNVAPTQFDLNFSLFGIPIRVHPLFWAVSAILGWNARHPNLMFIWILCVFVSILVHELGHALTAKSFGCQPHIVLYSFGGYASFEPVRGYTTRRAILILSAGPGAGFILYAVVRAIEHLLEQQGVAISRPAYAAFAYMEFINLWWGIANLLPVFPLDGGQISSAALRHWRPRDGFAISLRISIAVAAGMAFFLFSLHQTFNALLFGSLAFENLQNLQGGRNR